ncbi:hypothetical protein D621_05675 [beta proteobacterium AAP51]|nr:hypothetical protein D621_05675 [beta proteobacterium AAP51]
MPKPNQAAKAVVPEGFFLVRKTRHTPEAKAAIGAGTRAAMLKRSADLKRFYALLDKVSAGQARVVDQAGKPLDF